MGGDGPLADVEAVGDLFVDEAVGDEDGDLELALGEELSGARLCGELRELRDLKGVLRALA